MQVPRVVVAQVGLHDGDTGPDQSACHQQRPAKEMPAVTLGVPLGRVDHVEGVLHAGVGQQRDGRFAVPAQSGGCGMAFQSAALVFNRRQQFGSSAQATVGQALGQS